MRPRAVGILLSDHGEVLLMLRYKAGRHYASLPGGGIESGETPSEACAREMLEEVNLTVDVHEQLCVLENQGNLEHYFRVTLRSGEMRLGDGPERANQNSQNSYIPAWISADRLCEVNLLPKAIRPVVLSLLENS